jgi:hypothetical protein
VRDIHQGVFGSDITEIAVLGDPRSSPPTTANGKEIWSTDGTEQGTQLWVPETWPARLFEPTGLTAMGGALYFAADDGIFGRELGSSTLPDRLPPQLVRDIRPGSDGSNPRSCGPWKAALLRGGRRADGCRAVVSDGTPQFFGTRLDAGHCSGPQSSSPEALTNVNGSLVFRADNAFEGAEPWSWLALSGDFTFHWDLRPGSPSSGPAQFTLAGDRLFFTADDGFRGNELWSFDNHPPVAQAGADQVVQPGATVLLDGMESTDPDNPFFPLLSYEWRDFDGRVLGRFYNSVEVPNFQPGATEYTLIVRDGVGGRSEDTVKVSTPGRTAPVVTIVTPAAGEPLIVGTPAEIQWTVADPESIVESRVLLSTDNGTSYVPVCTGGPGPTGSCMDAAYVSGACAAARRSTGRNRRSRGAERDHRRDGAAQRSAAAGRDRHRSRRERRPRVQRPGPILLRRDRAD